MGTEPGRTALNFGIALLAVSGVLAVLAWLLFPARIALLCSVPLAFIGLVGLSFLIAEGVRRANTP